MAGDVVTAGTAGRDVTQDLPAADVGVTSSAPMPQPPSHQEPVPASEGDAGAPAAGKDPGKSGGSKKSAARSAASRVSRRSAPPAEAAGAGQAADGASGAAAVRRRLARLGATRSGGLNPVLEPLVKTVRTTHPKADIRLIERA